MSGFVALHREAFAHPLLKDAERFRAWFWLVANAAWKPTKHDARGHTITVERGQICAGREYLAKVWGWSPSAVERFLTRLQTEQMIERSTGQIKTIITICNYDKYQDFSDDTEHMSGQQTGQKPDRNRTAKEQGKQGNKVEEEADASPSTPARARKPQLPQIPDWIPTDPWNGFIAMRVKAGKRPTDRAVGLLIGKLDELRRNGHDPGKVLDQSTVKEWIDLYPVKGNDNDRSSAHRGPSAQPDRRSSLAKAIDEGLDWLDGGGAQTQFS